MSKEPVNSLFFWLDLETTGLYPEGNDQILEVAVAVTDENFGIRSVFSRVVGTTVDMSTVDPFVQDMHTKSGLWDEVRRASSSLYDVESGLLEYLSQYQGQLVLCGSTIHFDRRFVRRYWPRVEARLHYRMIDVSTIKLLARSWYGAEAPRGEPAHRAASDVRASIEELQHWRAVVFRETAPPAVPVKARVDRLDEVLTELEGYMLSQMGHGADFVSYAEAYTVLRKLRSET